MREPKTHFPPERTGTLQSHIASRVGPQGPTVVWISFSLWPTSRQSCCLSSTIAVCLHYPYCVINPGQQPACPGSWCVQPTHARCQTVRRPDKHNNLIPAWTTDVLAMTRRALDRQGKSRDDGEGGWSQLQLPAGHDPYCGTERL